MPDEAGGSVSSRSDEPVANGAKKDVAAEGVDRHDSRSRTAQRNLLRRWGITENLDEIPTEEFSRDPLVIGNHVLPCAVLSNRMRVLSQRGVTGALGGKRGGSHWRRAKTFGEDEYLPVFLSAANLSAYISPELRVALSKPVIYRPKRGGALGYGIPAELLPGVCEVYLKARKADRLTDAQKPIADAAEALISGLAKVGIIALVDEATGYQEVRERTELQRILAAYITDDLLPWTRRFPSEFYKELFRLRGWQWNPMSVKRPKRVGKDTVYIVYDRLPRGVLEELREKNPEVRPGYRKWRHHQFLTEDIGNPHLERTVAAATAVMRLSNTWAGFKRRLEVALPMPDRTLPIPGMEWAGEEDEEEGD